MMSEIDAESLRALQAQLEAQKSTIDSLKQQQRALGPQLEQARSEAAARAASASQLSRALQQKEARAAFARTTPRSLGPSTHATLCARARLLTRRASSCIPVSRTSWRLRG